MNQKVSIEQKHRDVAMLLTPQSIPPPTPTPHNKKLNEDKNVCLPNPKNLPLLISATMYPNET
jgi:hypothetical protein